MKKFAIIKSVDAPKRISPKDLRAYTERTISRLPQAGASMPPILVMLVSESVAAVVGEGQAGVVRHNRSDAKVPSDYGVWGVSPAGNGGCAVALDGILYGFHVPRVSFAQGLAPQ